MTGSFDVSCVEETWELAKRFAADLRPGDVVCLEGDLGAGKTTFTQGLAAALGLSGRVTSPTFCLVQEHRRPSSAIQNPHSNLHPTFLVHMDLYRLNDENDVLTIGWEDYLAEGAVLAVEWPERAGTLIPKNARHVRISYTGENFRRIDISSADMI